MRVRRAIGIIFLILFIDWPITVEAEFLPLSRFKNQPSKLNRGCGPAIIVMINENIFGYFDARG